jgi:hypothetical protein
MFLRNAG